MTPLEEIYLANKQAARKYARAFAHPDEMGWRSAVHALFAPNAKISIAHPFNDVGGPDEFLEQFIGSLTASFERLYRRDDILLSGGFDDREWVSSHGYFVGKFTRDWLGIKASNRLEYLRFGEFLRFESGQVVESIIFLDIPQLMMAVDQWPIDDSPGRERGYTGFLPGPATADGISLEVASEGETRKSQGIIDAMLSGLATEDQAWRPYWHENMMWYGPAAFGAFIGLEDFEGFQVPFEGAFTRWSGGISGNGVTEHFTRFSDGKYSSIGGWPSLMCIRKDAFLGQPASDETVFMRVCDWWRREDDLLVENWVIVDIPDVLLQMGVDLFPGHHNVPAGIRTINKN